MQIFTLWLCEICVNIVPTLLNFPGSKLNKGFTVLPLIRSIRLGKAGPLSVTGEAGQDVICLLASGGNKHRLIDAAKACNSP